MLTINVQIYQNIYLNIQQAINLVNPNRELQKARADAKMAKLKQEILNKPKNNPSNNN